MFDSESISRLITLLIYVAILVSAITGLVSLGNNYDTCVMMTSIVVMLSIIFITVVVEIYNMLNLSQKYLYYARSGLLVHYSMLAIGVSEIGLGFGILGILGGICNFIAGVFETESEHVAVNTYKFNGVMEEDVVPSN